MSFYDYGCTECNFILKDFYRSIKENVSVMDCPNCGNEMKHLFGTSTLNFKGTGFYETDYQNKNKEKKKDE